MTDMNHMISQTDWTGGAETISPNSTRETGFQEHNFDARSTVADEESCSAPCSGLVTSSETEKFYELR
jgi:hypothetical protein